MKSTVPRVTRRALAGVATLAVLTSAGLGAAAAHAAPNDPANVPDPGLRACLNSEIGQAATAVITEEQIAGIDGSLSCYNKNITDLTGLEHLTSAKELGLNGGPFTDLTPLSNLHNLTGIWLENSQVSNLNPIGNLSGLQKLSVNNTSVSDFSSTNNMPSLRALWINKSPVGDLSQIVTNSRLEQLSATNAQLTELPQDMSQMSALKKLDISQNSITSMSSLSSLTSLNELDISDNTTCNLDFLAGFNNLTKLSASSCQTAGISGVAHARQLEELEMENAGIESIVALAGLTHLQTIFLGNNQISDISALSQKPELKFLNIKNNNVEDLRPLQDSSVLRTLVFENNRVADISVLSVFAPDYTLYAAGNHIIDASPAIGKRDVGTFDRQTHRITVATGATVTNPVIDLDGQRIADPSPYYDSNSNNFTFPVAGSYETEWTSSVATRNEFSGTITWTVVDQTLVTPENPVVIQATRNVDGTVNAPSVTPAATTGLDYSLSTSGPQPGDTVTVTATPQALFLIDATHLPSGWVLNEQDGTASFTVVLDTLPKPDNPATPVDAKKPQALSNTGSAANAFAPFAASALGLAGIVLLLYRRAKQRATT